MSEENSPLPTPVGSREPQTHTFKPNDPPARLDRFLSELLELSRRQVRELLEAELVELNGNLATRQDKGTMLGPGDTIQIAHFQPIDQVFPLPNPDLSLPIVAQGEGWVIVDKPARMAVRPHHRDEMGTVLNALIRDFPELAGVGEGGLRSGIVHRLDTDTSGLLIVATKQSTWLELRHAFSQHRAKKTYLALVHGQLHGSERIVKHLRVARSRLALVEVYDQPPSGEATRQCAMTWTVKENLSQATLIEIDLETGFLHQVRAMMAHLGHPLVGDRRYGSPQTSCSARRHMLHAAALSIDTIHATSDLPLGMQAVIETMRMDDES